MAIIYLSEGYRLIPCCEHPAYERWCSLRIRANATVTIGITRAVVVRIAVVVGIGEIRGRNDR